MDSDDTFTRARLEDAYARGLSAGLVEGAAATFAECAKAMCGWCEIEGQKVDGLIIEPAHDEGDEGWFHDMTGVGLPYDGDPQECAAAAIRARAAHGRAE